MRKFCIKSLALMAVIIVSIALFEGLCTAWAWYQYRTVDVKELNTADANDAYLGEIVQKTAAFAETVRPNPYLGIVPNYESGPEFFRNGTGIDQFPTERDPSKFTILFTGASSAQLVACYADNGVTLLEHELRKLDFGGRELQVLNAAAGATTQPRHAVSLLMYGDLADAVVSLEGFNESGVMGRNESSGRLGTPGTWFYDLNPLVAKSYDRLGVSWVTNELRQYSMRHNSRSLFLLTKIARGQLQTSVADSAEIYSDAVTIWRLPDDWSKDRKTAWNLDRYKHFIQMQHGMAKQLGIREAYFIQPCPAIKKSLTDDERRKVGDLGYASAYQDMTDALLTLNPEVPVLSLLDTFEGVEESVYVDRVHHSMAGYRILAARIARDLSRLWDVPLRTTAEGSQPAGK